MGVRAVQEDVLEGDGVQVFRQDVHQEVISEGELPEALFHLGRGHELATLFDPLDARQGARHQHDAPHQLFGGGEEIIRIAVPFSSAFGCCCRWACFHSAILCAGV